MRGNVLSKLHCTVDYDSDLELKDRLKGAWLSVKGSDGQQVLLRSEDVREVTLWPVGQKHPHEAYRDSMRARFAKEGWLRERPE